MAETIRDPKIMRARILEARAAGKRVGFVPTMGALHPGHLRLVEKAVEESDVVAVSVFVNPCQFGPNEDYERYPRMFKADKTLLETKDVQWIFTPDVKDIYPHGDSINIALREVGDSLEGLIRPGHFSGVATVVLKLFNLVPAHRTYFGAKDWQQTRVVKQLIEDLHLSIELVVCPTVREADGLAMSSRNSYLSSDERRRAVGIVHALEKAKELWQANMPLADIESVMKKTMEDQGFSVDYAVIVDAESLKPTQCTGQKIALVAGHIGTTRLIDNCLLSHESEK